MGTKYLGRQLPHEVLETYRFRALQLRKEGRKVKDIAYFFGVHPNSVSRWFVIKNKEGRRALKSRRASGRIPKLLPKDTEKILEKLKRPATDFGFETPLWTCKRLGFLIQKTAKKKLDGSNVWRLLKRLGITNQKPERRAMQQNPREAKK